MAGARKSPPLAAALQCLPAMYLVYHSVAARLSLRSPSLAPMPHPWLPEWLGLVMVLVG
jgi:hypothetical protein